MVIHKKSFPFITDTVGWVIDVKGAKKSINDENGRLKKFLDASPIPIVPTALLYNVDSDVEKIELTFYKFGKWKTKVVTKSVIASKTNIIKLADCGIEVNSDNAGSLVTYLKEIVNANMDTIPQKPARTNMGWMDSGEEKLFVPYTDKVTFDGDDQFGYLYRAISCKGDYEAWKAFMKPLREKIEIRLSMAAAFASPLIEVVGQNPFVCHVWGKTGTGKSLSLLIAMSIWGNPAMGQLVRTMNMTNNSMLATAAFLNNLPFAGDELQTIKTRWGNYDNLIMQITEGIDRGRMSFDKVNETKSWRCSFLFSGEEPCVKADSGGGVVNRVIQIECEEQLVKDGTGTANFVRANYGYAGKKYIEQLLNINIGDIYNKHFDSVKDKTTTKQAGAMALLLSADEIASELFWPDEEPLTITDIQKYLASVQTVDVAERAYTFICSMIAENAANFKPDAKLRWGTFDDIKSNKCYMINRVLEAVLKENGFDFAAVKKSWASTGKAELSKDGKYRHQKKIGGVNCSCTLLILPEDEEVEDKQEQPNDELPF